MLLGSMAGAGEGLDLPGYFVVQRNEKLLVKGPYHVQILSMLNQTTHKTPGLMSVLSMCDTQQHLQGQASNQCTVSCAPLNLSAQPQEAVAGPNSPF